MMVGRSDAEIIRSQREEIQRLKIIRDFLKDWIQMLSFYQHNNFLEGLEEVK